MLRLMHFVAVYTNPYECRIKLFTTKDCARQRMLKYAHVFQVANKSY